MPQVKKLSVATVYGKIDLKELLNADKPVRVMRVLGQAVSSKSGESAYGRWTALLGRFKATNMDTGEVSEAAQLFLPEVALIPLQVAMSAGPVTFAIDLYVKPSTNTKPGGSAYEYTWEPVLQTTDADPLRQMEEQILALEAPADKGDDKKPADDKAKPKK